jgi:hypothetical protein
MRLSGFLALKPRPDKEQEYMRFEQQIVFSPMMEFAGSADW